MTAEIIQADYQKLEEIATRFDQQSQNQMEQFNRVQRDVSALKDGGWIGAGSKAFFAEMDNDVFPAQRRLTDALEQARSVTLEIKRIIEVAEKEAAQSFGGESIAIAGGASGGATRLPSDQNATVRPRIYIVNGINSAGNVPGRIGDDQSVALEDILERYGYGGDPNQVVSTPAIYHRPINTEFEGTRLQGTQMGGLLSPIDWLTGGGAATINTVTGFGARTLNELGGVYNSAYGVSEVMNEYIAGEGGPYTRETYDFIARDLETNPLLPGQEIILMGHSGGGVPISTLSGMLERNLGVDVSGVVSMGSPVSNYDEANRYAETIVQVRHQGDLVGVPVIRSEESRTIIPGALLTPNLYPGQDLVSIIAGETTGRYIIGGQPEVIDVTLTRPVDGGVGAAHGSYMSNDGVSLDMLHALQQAFPELELTLP